MMHKIRNLLSLAIVRYLIMAAFIVGIEVAVFFILNTPLHVNYLIATPISMAVGIVLNWHIGRKLVFKVSHHKPHIEFTLVAASSLIGVGIQLFVTFVSVDKFGLLPIVGKLLAIVITFFYNFLVRKYYIYGQEI